MKLPDWEKIKVLFTPFFILFYIFLIIAWYNREIIIKFLRAMFSGRFYY